MPPWSALPEHLNTPEKAAANFKDDQEMGWWGKFRARYKGHFAFGPRATEWWARWRELPITLLAFFGKGESRWENDIMAVRAINRPVFLYVPHLFYLSRVQYWCDWHIGLEWPLFFHCHFGNWQFYVGCKRDGDRVFWLSLYVGKIWK